MVLVIIICSGKRKTKTPRNKDDVFVGRTMVFKLKDGTLMCDIDERIIE